MDLNDKLREISNRIPRIIDRLDTAEATKHALIMPFIIALGYDVFDPFEVMPEFTTDVGTKKREKVDYAILRDGYPIILFECKRLGDRLDKITPSLLYRYLSVTDARFGVLTNGVHYQFFSDLESPNKMDTKPFLEFHMDEIGDDLTGKLKKFARDGFDMKSTLSTASELRYLKVIKRLLREEWMNPSEDFVRLFVGRAYSGRITESVKEQFTDIVNRALHEFISEHFNERLRSTPRATSACHEEAEAGEPSNEETEIVMTEEEIEQFYVERFKDE